MRLKLLAISIFFSISSQTFAITKNIDFYTGPSDNTNRFTVSGMLSEINNAEFNGSTLLVEGLNASSYITLNDKAPYFISYNEQNLNLYELLNKNKGKTITIDGTQYKVVGFTGEFIILTGTNSDRYIFKRIDDSIELPKEWFIQVQKGLKASFDDQIKESDKLYYSQNENGLTYTNDYQGVIQDDSKINLVHYININNGTDKIFDNVNLSFFLSETNVTKKRPEIMYKAMSAVSSDAIGIEEKPEFKAVDISGLKVITLGKPVTIQPNMNKIKHTDKLYTYENYVNIYLNDNFPVYFTPNDNSNDYEKIYNNAVSDIKNSLITNKNLFTDRIKIKLDKDDILASGNIDIYEKNKDNSKLIISTNLIHNEKSDLDIEKSQNRDLKIVDVNTVAWDKYKKSEIDIKNGNFKIDIVYISIKNDGKHNYNVMYKDKKYIIKSGEIVNIYTN